MTSRCPTCDRPFDGTAARNDRRTVSVEIPEDLIPLMIEVMRDTNNRYVMYGDSEKAGRLRVVADAITAARPEELRGFEPNGWARALEGVSKGYDVRIETVPSVGTFGEARAGRSDVCLMVDLEDKGTIKLAVASGRKNEDVAGIVAYVKDAFERFRPMV